MKALLLAAALYFSQLSAATPATGTVSGQLLDAAGKPVAAMRIAAAELPRPGTSLESSNVLAAITQTDSAGRYRLENIPPGRYYILAGLVDFPTYFPGVNASEEAKVIEITAGASIGDLVFSLARPKTVKVRGRLAGEILSAVPVTLFSTVSSAMQSESRADGSFEFANVPLGRYVIRAAGFTPMNLAVDGKDLNIDLAPLYSGPGVRVSGKVVAKSGMLQAGIIRTVTLTPLFIPAGFTGSVGTLGGALGPTSGVLLETFVRDDGSFEFPAVPAGTYTLRSLPAAPGVATANVSVGTLDVRGLEIAIPFQLDVAGRILLDGHSFASSAIVESRQRNFGSATSVRSDGTFRLRLTEGENEIAVARLPSEFAVVSITYGLKDIMGVPLRLGSGATAEEILVTIERMSPSSVNPGVRESARFAGVQVGGRASVVDSQGKAYPLMPANLSVSFKRPNGSGGSASILSDGTFRMPLPEELYMVTVNNVAAPYRVKAISSGATDLLKEPLEVTSREAPTRIEVILEYKPAVQP